MRPRVTRLGHVLVLGGSMAGLLAARVLADHADRVTVVERDDLRRFGNRPGVPQGRHVHALLARGQQILEDLLPGVTEELLADGAISVRALEEMRFTLHGHTLAKGDAGYSLVQAGRPLIEWRVRERVRALENVSLLDRTTATALLRDGTSSRVTGVRMVGEDAAVCEEHADLVVSSLGRFGPILDWLRELGYDAPPEEGVPIDMLYVSRELRLRGSPGGDKEIIVADQRQARAMALFAIEHDRHILTLIGYGDHHPPTDDEGFWEFAAAVAPPDVAAALAQAEPVTEAVTYRYRANLRRRFERLQRFPEGLLVLGDAVCSFSPAFGQGMTMSAVQAEQLERVLSEGTGDLAPRFFAAASRAVDDAWLITKLFDQSMPHIAAPWYQGATQPALDLALAVAARSPRVAVQATRILGLLDRPHGAIRPGVAVGAVEGLLGAATSAVAGRVRPRRSPDFDPAPAAPVRGFFSLAVADVERLTRDSVAITLTVPEDLRDTFGFSAGQHVTIRGLHRGAPVRRSYSVCEPEGSRRLRIAVKHQPGGAFSTYATRDLRPGDVLQVAPPAGRFSARPAAPGLRYAAVAAGSGITPVLSIVATTLAADPDVSWTLHYANRTRHDTMFRRELDALTARHRGRLTVVHHLSRESAGPGRLDPRSLAAQDADEWFCCGPAALAGDVADVLRAQGLPAARLHVELFTARAAGRRVDPTAPPSEVVLCGAGPDVVAQVRPGESILNAALAVREDLPYACLGGSCGTCLAEVTSGEVTVEEVPFMALTDEDRAAGLVLACLASPSTPEVRLRFTADRETVRRRAR